MNDQNWEDVAGSNELVKRLNAYLTNRFSENCLDNAIELSNRYKNTKMGKSEFTEWVNNFLTKQFMPISPINGNVDARQETIDVLELLKNYADED